MKMSTRVFITIVGLLIIMGVLGGVKGLQIKRMIAHGQAFIAPPQTVTVAKVKRMTWETTLSAVGSLQAVKGVVVTAELPSKITRINFEPGSRVIAGQLLLQQDISIETAQLREARSMADLALKELKRSRKLLQQKVIPVARLDELEASHEQALAQIELIQATIDKKTIRAPFAGRLGIRQVNLGEVLDTGQPIVTLQSLDPIYVNFQLPQQHLPKLKPGLKVRIDADALEGQIATGRISTVNPEVNDNTRNIAVQAILTNKRERLRPGMYVSVAVVLPARKKVITIPATAVHYAPYSDSVFLVEAAEGNGHPASLVLRQLFVQLGEKRGDYVVVREGLEPGQSVVSTGVFKLRNGQAVVVDNSLSPKFETAPKPADA
jgi:membrane fusion protein (multidrug efflux system)